MTLTGYVRYGKPGNVRDFIRSRGNCWGKNLAGKSGLKLFIVIVSIGMINTGDERDRRSTPDYLLDFAEFVHFSLILDHARLHSYPHH